MFLIFFAILRARGPVWPGPNSVQGQGQGFLPKQVRHGSVSIFDRTVLQLFSGRNFGPDKNRGRFPTQRSTFWSGDVEIGSRKHEIGMISGRRGSVWAGNRPK